MEALSKRFADQGFVILAISDETPDKVKPFIAERKITYPILLDPEHKVSDQFQVNGIPKSFVYDREGKLGVGDPRHADAKAVSGDAGASGITVRQLPRSLVYIGRNAWADQAPRRRVPRCLGRPSSRLPVAAVLGPSNRRCCDGAVSQRETVEKDRPALPRWVGGNVNSSPFRGQHMLSKCRRIY